MLGCLRRLGCLTILIVAGVMLYLNRDMLPVEWTRRAREVAGAPPADPAPPRAAADGVWAPLTPEGAARGRRAVAALGARTGPVYATLAPADLAAFVYDALRQQLPPSAEGVEAAVIGDQLHVRAVVRLADLGDVGTLGPLAQLLADRDTVQFGGTLGVVRAGLAEFRVRQIRLRQFPIPSALVPGILARLNPGARPAGVAADALPLEIPPYVGDVRIGGGRVTLYKAIR